MSGCGRSRRGVFDMAKWTMHGLDEYARSLQKLGANTPEIIGAGVYEMARVIADRVHANLDALPFVPSEKLAEYYRNGVSPLTYTQKVGLQLSFGISPMQNDRGYYNVKIGFDGYNSTVTKKYPRGQPNAMIARVTESGSSYRQKTPFIRPAVRQSEREALKAAKIRIDERIFAL